MALMEAMTLDQVMAEAEVWGFAPTLRGLLVSWLERGDAILVYRNVDLGHPRVGQPVFTSYGSPDAQVEQTQYPEPPAECPVDLSGIGEMHWRFRLAGIVQPDG